MSTSGSRLPENGRPDLGSRLRARRESVGLTGVELAGRTGLNPSKISRIETGRTAPSADDIRLIGQKLRLDTAEIDELVGLTARRHPPSPRRAEGRGELAGIARKQDDVGRAELAAREIRIFQPTVVPGLLQTSGYAEGIMRSPLRLAGLLSAEEPAAALFDAVGGRIQRQRILRLPDKSFHIVMTESVLANRLTPPEDMLAQIRRIREIAELDNVSVRIIPDSAALIAPPTNAFEMLDADQVMIDLFHDLLVVRSPADVETYQQVFEAMTSCATDAVGDLLDKYARVYKDELA